MSEGSSLRGTGAGRDAVDKEAAPGEPGAPADRGDAVRGGTQDLVVEDGRQQQPVRVLRPRAGIGMAARVALCVGIFAVLLSRIPVSEVFASVARVQPEWLLLAVLIVAIERLLSAVRVTSLSTHLDMPLTLWRNLEISLAATFYGLILPGEVAGGAVRWYKMSRPAGQRAQAAAVVTLDKLIGTFMAVLVGLVFFVVEAPAGSNAAIEATLLLLLAAMLVVLWVGMSRNTTTALLKPLHSLAKRFHMHAIYDTVDEALSAVARFRELPRSAAVLLGAASLARQLAAIALLFVLARALGIDVDYLTLGWIHALTSVAVLLPISVSGLGVREGTMVYLLGLNGVPGSQSLALSLLMFSSLLLLAAAGGITEARYALRSGREPVNR